ncbi:MAG: hypothetical protein ABEK01_04740 [Candidatus Nanohaloarchaea archaeon]
MAAEYGDPVEKFGSLVARYRTAVDADFPEEDLREVRREAMAYADALRENEEFWGEDRPAYAEFHDRVSEHSFEEEALKDLLEEVEEIDRKARDHYDLENELEMGGPDMDPGGGGPRPAL